MKRRSFALIIAIVFITILLTSCHASEPPCPAYANINAKDVFINK